MSSFDEPYKEAFSAGNPADVAVQPSLGFLAGVEASYDAQVRAHGVRSIEAALADEEQSQIDRARKAGVTIPSLAADLSDIGSIDVGALESGAAQPSGYRVFSRPDAADDGERARADKVTKEIEQARAARPDLNLKTPSEMFADVKKKAGDADALAKRAGFFGGLVGGAAGSFNPRTDPLNAMTLPLGGFGPNVTTRIASEAGVGMLTEGLNQATGVAAERQALGLQQGAGDIAQDIFFSGVGAGALRGVFEGAGAVARRWFTDIPAPEAPRSQTPVSEAPSPLPGDAAPEFRTLRPLEDFGDFMELVNEKPNGPSMLGQGRARDDARAVLRQMEDWDGPLPSELRPATAAPPTINRATFTPLSDMKWRSVEDFAREVDPATFRAFDKYAAQAQDLRGQIRELGSTRERDAVARVAGQDAALAEFDRGLERTSPKNRKAIETQRAAAQAERDRAFTEANTGDTPAMATARQQLMRLDEKMRDLAPLVSRATAAAQGKFRESGLDVDTLRLLRDMEQRGGVTFDTSSRTGPLTVERPVSGGTARRGVEGSPESVRPPASTETPTPRTPEEFAARTAELKVVEDKMLDVLAERVRMFKVDGGDLVTPGGRKIDLNEKITTVDDDGNTKEVSIRSLIDEIDEEDTVFKAIQTCSVGPASATASQAS